MGGGIFKLDGAQQPEPDRPKQGFFAFSRDAIAYAVVALLVCFAASYGLGYTVGRKGPAKEVARLTAEESSQTQEIKRLKAGYRELESENNRLMARIQAAKRGAAKHRAATKKQAASARRR